MLVRRFLPLLEVSMLVAGALVNMTIDDTDTGMITYQGGTWDTSAPSALDYGGTHMVSGNTTCAATFVFTGVDVYYLAPRWPYNVYSRLSLDGQASVLVNMTDPNPSASSDGAETAMYSVAWSGTNLANISHSVLITFGTYCVVDGFIYTVDNGASPTSESSAELSPSSTSASTSASGSPSETVAAPSSRSSSSKGLTIGLATGLSLAALVAAMLVACILYQRRRRPTSTRFVIDESPSVLPVRGAISPAPQMSTTLDAAFQYQPFSVGQLPPGAGLPVVQDAFSANCTPFDQTPSSSTRYTSPVKGDTTGSGSGATGLWRGISKPPPYSA
ncbi:hypothetical protein K438DRAFT_2026054 [Mycena galopus ATCC 62051]|nr:hypothetical protein K438DRAFT_2026054 [Mycena galopus ATCC 62051]